MVWPHNENTRSDSAIEDGVQKVSARTLPRGQGLEWQGPV